jgi:eukaryotic-like serine/threonine-protein kinase
MTDHTAKPDDFSPGEFPQDKLNTLASALLTPTQIGPYRILETIGTGGMGVVYRARQDFPIKREVVLKLIKLGMDTKSVIARFEAERQALAMMNHPHIAKVFDAGTDDTGRPYFVMEYVKGQPITTYADTQKLTLNDRLKLHQQVCEAVQHAHHKGVVHRDLKPSNVLVFTQDGKPFAKVIDFGIAKAMNQQLTEKTLFTEHRQMIGTPEYMSPEQADGNIDIDTRTDVYSLGVLLYELLTGQTPFDGARLRSAAYDAMVRIIREEEPPKPSVRLSTLAISGPIPAAKLRDDASGTATLFTLAKSRSTDEKQFQKQIKGELDWLVMKAMDKDRARRYTTPTDLSQDIERYLSGTPIVAAPPSWGYRAKKFGRKHRTLLTAAAATSAILITAGTFVLFQSYRLRRSNQELRKSNEALTAANELLTAQANLATLSVSDWMNSSEATPTNPLVGAMLNDQMLKLFRSGKFATSGYVDQRPLSDEERVRAAMAILANGLTIQSVPPSEIVMPGGPFPSSAGQTTQPVFATQPSTTHKPNRER